MELNHGFLHLLGVLEACENIGQVFKRRINNHDSRTLTAKPKISSFIVSNLTNADTQHKRKNRKRNDHTKKKADFIRNPLAGKDDYR